MNWEDRVMEFSVLEHHCREVRGDLGHAQAVPVVVAARSNNLEKSILRKNLVSRI